MTSGDASLPPVLPEEAAALVAAVAGSVLLPGDAGYGDERAERYARLAAIKKTYDPTNMFRINHNVVPTA